MNFAVAGASSEGLEPASEPTGRGCRRGRGRLCVVAVGRVGIAVVRRGGLIQM